MSCDRDYRPALEPLEGRLVPSALGHHRHRPAHHGHHGHRRPPPAAPAAPAPAAAGLPNLEGWRLPGHAAAVYVGGLTPAELGPFTVAVSAFDAQVTGLVLVTTEDPAAPLSAADGSGALPPLDLGFTSFHFDASGHYAGASMLFQGGYFPPYDLESVALHEIGHAVGLAHQPVPGTDPASSDGNDVMFASLGAGVVRHAYDALDVAELDALYAGP